MRLHKTLGLHKALLTLGMICAIAAVAHAQEQRPGVIVRGSSDCFT